MPDEVQFQVEENVQPSVSRKLRTIVADAFAFVRGAEVNKALADVSIEDLMGDQIKRNGDSAAANAGQYNPYKFEAGKDLPAGTETTERANFLGGADTQRPTKRDRIVAIQNELNDAIDEIKKIEIVDVADAEVYADATEIAAPEE